VQHLQQQQKLVYEKQYFERLIHISHTCRRRCSNFSATLNSCGSGWYGYSKKFDRSATFRSSVLATRLVVRLQKFKKLEGSCFLCLTQLLERDTIALSSLRHQVVVEGALWGHHDEGAICTDITRLVGSYTRIIILLALSSNSEKNYKRRLMRLIT
jgi:hypothetical protein